MFIAALLLMLSFTVWSVASAEGRARTYALPGRNVFPEGIAYQPSEHAFYVSSTTNGAIFRAELNDRAARVFLPGGQHDRVTAVGLDVDGNNRLYIAGGASQGVWIYDTRDASLIASLKRPGAGFINDVVATTGGAYFTDSMVPIIYRAYQTGSGWEIENWLDLRGTVLQYQPGFNLNGIDASANGRYLVVVQSNTGKLFRISLTDRTVTEIDLGGETVTSGDGIILHNRTLYVVRNSVELVVKIKLSGDLSSGTVVSVTTDPSYMFPTTAAIAEGRLLVVNSQFNARGGNPVHPFTVSSVPLP
jgi:Cu-Zn family superoxide dismutase